MRRSTRKIASSPAWARGPPASSPLRADYFHFPPDTSETEHVAQRPGGTAAAAVPAAAAAMSAAAAGAHAHAGGPGAGAAQAAPVLDMSRHKSGIVPVVQCVRASVARRPSLVAPLSPGAAGALLPPPTWAARWT